MTGKKEMQQEGTGETMKNIIVKVPVLVNTEPLAKGTVLRVYRPPAPKRHRGPEPISLAKLQRLAAKEASS